MKTKKWVNENSETELTIEKLKSQKGFENFTDEQALRIIQNIKRLANLLFNRFANNNHSNII